MNPKTASAPGAAALVARVGQGIVTASGATPQALATLDEVLTTFDDDAAAFVWLLDDHTGLGGLPLLAVRAGRHRRVRAAALAAA